MFPRLVDSGGMIDAAAQELRDLLAFFPFRPTSDEAAMLTPYLYLGSCAHAKHLGYLKHIGVTDVINCAESEVGTEHYDALHDATIATHGFDSSDAKDYPMISHYDAVLAMVTEVRQKKGICLIHCQAGVNRSGFLAIALLCAMEGYTLLKAAAWAREKRGRVCTNQGFQEQLLQLAREQHWSLQ